MSQNPLEHFKELTKQKLARFDWHQDQVLRCRAYIENNGTKTISLEEIRDYMLQTAMKSFPKPVMEEMSDEIERFVDECCDEQ